MNTTSNTSPSAPRPRSVAWAFALFLGIYILIQGATLGVAVWQFAGDACELHESRTCVPGQEPDPSSAGDDEVLVWILVRRLALALGVSTLLLAGVMLLFERKLLLMPRLELARLSGEVERKNRNLGREIAERKQIASLLEFKTTQLERQEKLLGDIIEDQSELICRFLPDGTLTFVNSAYCRFTGHAREDLVEVASFLGWAEEVRGSVVPILGTLHKDRPTATSTVAIAGCSDALCWIQWTFRALLTAEGEVQEFQAVGRDVTEFRKLHLQLQASYKVLEQRVAARTREILEQNEKLAQQIQERIRAEDEARRNEQLLSFILDGIGAAYLIVDRRSGVVVACNQGAGQLLGIEREALLDVDCAATLEPWLGKSCAVVCAPRRDDPVRHEFILTPARGDSVPVDRFAIELWDERVALVFFDISERKRLERQLGIAQKMESIGLLASGIAHEINTPIQYAGDSVRFLKEALTDSFALLAEQTALLEQVAQLPDFSAPVRRVEELAEEIDIAFLREEAPRAVERALDGVGRVAGIVQAMKSFAHPGAEEKKAVNINKALETTITIAKNEWKYVADVAFEPQVDLPLVTCLPGDVNQVFLNIIVNASHAIRDVVGESGKKGLITIRTQHVGNVVEISFIDTGTGIKAENIDKIFDPFFTTKPVGKGTGQGLAITHDIVVNKHGGAIDVSSKEGQGTTFLVRLPVTPTA